MWVGKFPQRATTGYPFTVPCVDSLVLSAYRIKAKGAALSTLGRWLFRLNRIND
jgi:hypothetical protein